MKIEELSKQNIDKVVDLFQDNWGTEMIVVHNKKYSISDLDGFIALKLGKIVGVITYLIENEKCEIISLDSFHEEEGIGEKLVEKVYGIAYDNNCKSLWHVTTNDNINAIRFYQMRGFDMVELKRDVISESRKTNPNIPEYGYYEIPVKHEIKFELEL